MKIIINPLFEKWQIIIEEAKSTNTMINLAKMYDDYGNLPPSLSPEEVLACPASNEVFDKALQNNNNEEKYVYVIKRECFSLILFLLSFT